MNYRLTGTEELIEITLERIAKRKLAEKEGKTRKVSAVEARRAEIRREIERRQDLQMVDAEMKDVWEC